MKKYNITDAGKNLGIWLDLAMPGEEIVITHYGKGCIKLVPIKKEEISEEKKLPGRAEFRSKIKIKENPLSKTVIENTTH